MCLSPREWLLQRSLKKKKKIYRPTRTPDPRTITLSLPTRISPQPGQTADRQPGKAQDLQRKGARTNVRGPNHAPCHLIYLFNPITPLQRVPHVSRAHQIFMGPNACDQWARSEQGGRSRLPGTSSSSLRDVPVFTCWPLSHQLSVTATGPNS